MNKSMYIALGSLFLGMVASVNAIEFNTRKFDQLANYIGIINQMLAVQGSTTQTNESGVVLEYAGRQSSPSKKIYSDGQVAFKAPGHLVQELQNIIAGEQSKIDADENVSYFIDRYIYKNSRSDVIAFLDGSFIVKITKQGGSQEYPNGIYLFVAE